MLQRTLLDWQGQTAVILASGPSLTTEQCAIVGHGHADRKTLAVNSTMLDTFCDVGYAGDFMWWKTHVSKLPKSSPEFSLWTCERSAAERWGLSWVKGVNRLGLGRGPHINTNGNSGAQAVNLAYLFGARRILLLGFDMKLGPNGEKHHHPDHPSRCVQSQTFEEWIRKFGILAEELKAAGCEVINCTPDSALKCFPMSTIEKELP
jgi:hypothetical protein